MPVSTDTVVTGWIAAIRPAKISVKQWNSSTWNLSLDCTLSKIGSELRNQKVNNREMSML